MGVLAIDYDGVIVDSILDSLFVSHNAFIKIMGEKGRKNFGGRKLTFQNWPEITKKHIADIQTYRFLRPYIREATDYGLIHKIMEEKIKIRNQQEFDHYRQNTTFDFQAFHEAFYQERERIQQENYQNWLSLEPPYQSVIHGIRQFVSEGARVLIATSNRTESIAKIFLPQFYDIPVSEEDILDYRFGNDKTSQIQHIRHQLGVDYHDICFVDDQLSHLEKTRLLGIKVFLAGWSYANSQQKAEARLMKIPIIERQEDFYPVLKSYIIENKEEE